MRYVAAHFCKSCDSRLSFNEMMDSFGVCPDCGASSGGTVVDCYTKAIKVEKTGCWLTKLITRVINGW